MHGDSNTKSVVCGGIMSNHALRKTNSPEDGESTESPDRPSAVLLVARNRDLQDTCRRKLSDAGIEVVFSTQSSEQALELIDHNHLFDAVVIGVDAGDVEAAKLVRHMSRCRADTPTVVMSSISHLRISGIEQPSQMEDLRKIKRAGFGRRQNHDSTRR